jgi:Ca-activated chloride channel family protein
MLMLLPLPWVLRRLLSPRSRQLPALRVPFYGQWQALAAGPAGRLGVPASWLAPLLLSLVWLGLVVAAARPQWIGDPVELPNSGRDLMLAVDISGSMRVEDMQAGDRLVRRIDAVKVIASDFIGRRRGDRLGLILFGSNAYLQSPLSFDVQTVQRFLMESQIGFAGQETAIGDAIGLAVKRLRDRPAESRVLVLLTDGRDTASTVDPMEAAKLAAQLGVRIHTIGIGADSLTVPGLLGTRIGSRQVNPSADLDEESLRAIADSTGGQFFRARDPEELAAIYGAIEALEPLESDRSLYRPQQSLAALPLGIALCASFLLALRHVGLLPAWPARRAAGTAR